MKKQYCIGMFLFALLYGGISSAVLHAAVVVRDRQEYYEIGRDLEIFEDKKNEYTINDLLTPKAYGRFKKSGREVPNYGFNESSFWIRFDIIPRLVNNETKGDYVLEIAYPHFDFIELFIFDSQGGLRHMKTGDCTPFNTRIIDHRNFVAPLRLHNGVEQTVFVYVKSSGAFQLPFRLMSINYFIKKEQRLMIIHGVFYGVLIIICVVSILLFLMLLDKVYLLYALFLISVLLFQATFDGLAFQLLWPGCPWWANKSMPFIITMVPLSILLFSRSFLALHERWKKTDKAIIVFSWITAGTSVTVLFVPYALAIQVATLYSGVIAALVLVMSILISFRGSTFARSFAIALTLFLVGVIVFTANMFGIIPRNYVTNNAYQLGTVFQIIILYFSLGRRFTEMRMEKNEAENAAEREREKYKIIVEESDEIIFSLDENWNIISANKAIKKHLKIPQYKIAPLNLLELIYEDDDYKRNETVQLIHEKLEMFNTHREPVAFKARFKSSFSGEPVDLNVRLEHISIDGKSEILGKATNMVGDSLLKYFVKERQKYIIENYLLTADEIAQRLTRNLTRYTEMKMVNMIRIALREILINAVEHGNLNITFEEKTASIDDGTYFQLIEERRKHYLYRNRYVSIDYSLDEDKVTYKITDEGGGFDYRSLMQKEKSGDEVLELAHGRGLHMAKNIFDTIRFNKKGNQVLLVKQFKE